MLDLIAAISSADPPSLLAWAVLAFAAGMYPVGIMLGSSCSPCCNPCGLCAEGQLPETVTVTFDGLPDQTPGPDLITLGFSACYGSGAAARVTAPGGDPETDKGPISAVDLTNAGGGYAKLGRVAPTLTVSGGSGTGATFTPTLTSTNDACGIPSWSLASVAVTGGDGYVDGEALTITFAEGDTEVATATAVVNTTASEPAVTASVSGGSGATLTVTLEESGGWIVSAVTVVDGGTGYTDGDSVTFTPGSGTTSYLDANATIVVGRTEPTVTASATGGTGADLSVTLSQETDEFGDKYWTVLGVDVIDGGTDYTDGDPVTFAVTDGTSEFSATGYIVVTDGEITAVDVPYSPYYPYESGYYYKSTGVIESVMLFGGGSYYKESGALSGVTVTNGGQYFREDASEPPYVADVTVTITQALPSAGAGAEITATVEDDTSSPNFGKITALTIASGGDDYLAWEWRNTKCCGDYYNGMSVVLQRMNYGSGDPCVYEHRFCGAGNVESNTGAAKFFYYGPSTPPVLQLLSEFSPSGGAASAICTATFTTTENITNCDNIDATLEASDGATATVAAGGEYDATYRNPGGGACHICCKGDEERPAEIEVDVQIEDRGPTPPGAGQAAPGTRIFQNAGNYVLARTANGYSGVFPWTSTGTDPVSTRMVGIGVGYELCAEQSATGFSEDIYGCDNCHKKCRVVAGISPPFGTDFEFWWFDSRRCVDQFGLYTEDQCGGICEETPICNFSGKSFSLCLVKQSPWEWVFQCGELEPRFEGDTRPSLYDDGCGAITITVQ